MPTYKALDVFVKNKLRQLTRLYAKHEKLKQLHRNREQNFTYHAGHNKGYIAGRICEIEAIFDALGIDFDQEAVNGVSLSTGHSSNKLNCQHKSSRMSDSFTTTDGYTLQRQGNIWSDGDLEFKSCPDTGLPLDESGELLDGASSGHSPSMFAI